ncbi:MAG: hypothetical protein IJJ52_03380 [Lachnospiraceae bacterium]|nr:hypothetical protein [Lachnospiraceae bacterium]
MWTGYTKDPEKSKSGGWKKEKENAEKFIKPIDKVGKLDYSWQKSQEGGAEDVKGYSL